MINDVFQIKVKNKIDHYIARYGDNEFKIKFHTLLYVLKQILHGHKKHKSKKDNIIHALFKLDGGIGDILLAINLLYNIKSETRNLDITVNVDRKLKPIVEVLIAGHSFLNISDNQDERNYDLVFSCVRAPIVEYANMDKIKGVSKQLFNYIEMLQDFMKENGNYFLFGTGETLLETYSMLQGRNRTTEGNIENFWKQNKEFRIKTSSSGVLQKYNLKAKKFITVNRGVGTADGIKSDKSTRLWPINYYNQLIELIKKEYPQYTIVQIGAQDCPQISRCDKNLLGQTSFNELLELLKNSILHIDGECGMVHLKHFLGEGKSVVIFGPTKADFYGYPENINIFYSSCRGCEWTHKRWRLICLKNRLNPLCMKNITPEMVINIIRKRSVDKL